MQLFTGLVEEYLKWTDPTITGCLKQGCSLEQQTPTQSLSFYMPTETSVVSTDNSSK